MEICEICKKEGNENVEFKNIRGLKIHIRRKHGIGLDEYNNEYKTNSIEKGEVEPEKDNKEQESVKETIVKSVKEVEPEKEISSENKKQEINGMPKINDYTLLSASNFVAVFRFESTGNETYKKIIGIGSVVEENKNTVSALIIGDDGLIIPVFMIPEFVGIVEISSKDFRKAVKSGWTKQKKIMRQKIKKVSSRPGLFTRKKKSTTRNVTNDELAEGFSKILARKRK